jgi:hypothetical protein
MVTDMILHDEKNADFRTSLDYIHTSSAQSRSAVFEMDARDKFPNSSIFLLGASLCRTCIYRALSGNFLFRGREFEMMDT